MTERSRDIFDAVDDVDIPQQRPPRSHLLTVRLAPEEAEALAAMAARLGVGRSTLARIFLRQGLGLGKGGR